MRTFNFTNRYGTEYEIAFEKMSYAYGGGLAIAVHCQEEADGWWEPYATLTVNIDPLPSPSMAYLDTNNVPDLAEFVVEKGWAREIGFGQSGYCTYPLVKFTEEFLDEICASER